MKKTIRHGGVVRCDVPNCPETFTTYSVSRLARRQAADVGWTRPKLRQMPDWENFGLGGGQGEEDRLLPVVSPGPSHVGGGVS